MILIVFGMIYGRNYSEMIIYQPERILYSIVFGSLTSIQIDEFFTNIVLDPGNVTNFNARAFQWCQKIDLTTETNRTHVSALRPDPPRGT